MSRTALTLVALATTLAAGGCAKRVRLTALPLARGGQATVRVELTYDRNNALQVQLANVPPPDTFNPQYTRYVLWVATPERQSVVNAGQLRVDQNRKAEIRTLTPFRSFVLFITAEAHGEAIQPGPDVVFESGKIQW
jgi:hypothetical protein